MSNDSTSHSKQKQDYRKDGHCTAKAPEEKGCLHFVPVHNGIRKLELCVNQNMGRVCEVKK